MSFITWLFKPNNSSAEKRKSKGIKRVYDRGYKDGWIDATKRLREEEFEEGKAEGWKEAMSTVINMADKMLLKPKSK